jgi:hypothetical protein
MNTIVCFITHRPSELFYKFVKQLPYKNIYICIDDNNYNIPNYKNDLNIIKVDNQLCENEGFKGSVLYFKDKACARDKALYYFCRNNIEYDYIWFIEEDVFIPTTETLPKLDNKYKDADLLSAGNGIIYQREENWHWNYINQHIKFEPPYASSMICAIRCSKKLISCINEYVTKYKDLFLDEAFFNTIALKNNLSVVTPIELSTIHFRKDFNKKEFYRNNLYHPVKDIRLQYEYRKAFKGQIIFQKPKKFSFFIKKIFI